VGNLSTEKLNETRKQELSRNEEGGCYKEFLRFQYWKRISSDLTSSDNSHHRKQRRCSACTSNTP